MLPWKATRLRKRAAHAYRSIGTSRLRHRDVLERFAKQHHLSYFSPDVPQRILERIDERRTWQTHGLLEGEHAEYMTTLYSYTAAARHEQFASTEKSWLEVEVELRHTAHAPFVFIGTRQQTKTQYAELLAAHPGARYLHISCPPLLDRRFHERYAVLAAAEDASFVRDLFTDEVVQALVNRHTVIAYHIEGNQLSALTELQKPRIQLVDRLFHAGIWMARVVDDLAEESAM